MYTLLLLGLLLLERCFAAVSYHFLICAENGRSHSTQGDHLHAVFAFLVFRLTRRFKAWNGVHDTCQTQDDHTVFLRNFFFSVFSHHQYSVFSKTRLLHLIYCQIRSVILLNVGTVTRRQLWRLHSLTRRSRLNYAFNQRWKLILWALKKHQESQAPPVFPALLRSKGEFAIKRRYHTAVRKQPPARLVQPLESPTSVNELAQPVVSMTDQKLNTATFIIAPSH